MRPVEAVEVMDVLAFCQFLVQIDVRVSQRVRCIYIPGYIFREDQLVLCTWDGIIAVRGNIANLTHVLTI